MTTVWDETRPLPMESPQLDDDKLPLLELDGMIHQDAPDPIDTAGMLLLTCPSLGLQICWFLLQSSGTPYLLSLGLSSSSISWLWALSPIFGAFAQPVIGLLSDDLEHPWGRRKPVMAVGALAVIASILGMAWAEELAGWSYGETSDNHWQAQVFAVSCLVVMLLALNCYSVGARSIVVDNCAPHQQSQAAAWSMRWNVLGSAVLSTVGFVNVKRFSVEAGGVVGFKTLALVASVLSALTVGLVCSLVPRERAKHLHTPASPVLGRICTMGLPGELAWRWARLPRLTHQVCNIQLYAWAGWFPVLYYMSAFASETAWLEMADLEANGYRSDLEKRAKDYGLYGPFAFSLGTLGSAVILQILENGSLVSRLGHTRVWMVSQGLAGVCLVLTLFVHSAQSAVVILAIVGTTWAVTMWVPFAIINTELSGQESEVGVAGVQGIHNMAISLPQIASALVCAVVLGVLNLLRLQQAVGWLIRLASVPVMWSVWLIWQLELDYVGVVR